MKNNTVLKEQIVRCAKNITVKPYESQSMPKEYSVLKNYSRGTPQPPAMQQAFIAAVLH